MLDELAGVDLDLEARALADTVPQSLERRVERDVLLQLDGDLLGLVADLDPLGLVNDDCLDLLLSGSSSAGSSTLPSSAAAFSSGVTAPLPSTIPVATRWSKTCLDFS